MSIKEKVSDKKLRLMNNKKLRNFSAQLNRRIKVEMEQKSKKLWKRKRNKRRDKKMDGLLVSPYDETVVLPCLDDFAITIQCFVRRCQAKHIVKEKKKIKHMEELAESVVNFLY